MVARVGVVRALLLVLGLGRSRGLRGGCGGLLRLLGSRSGVAAGGVRVVTLHVSSARKRQMMISTHSVGAAERVVGRLVLGVLLLLAEQVRVAEPAVRRLIRARDMVLGLLARR